MLVTALGTGRAAQAAEGEAAPGRTGGHVYADRVAQRPAALAAERQKLLSEIDNKQLTLNDLHAGLERIRQENSRLKSESEQQQRQKRRVDADLQKLQADITRLGSDTSLSDAAKREQIEALKKRIKAYLEVMLIQ